MGEVRLINLEIANSIYQELTKKEYRYNQEFTRLRDKLFKDAITYTNVRAEWHLKDKKEKLESDSYRKTVHDILIYSCDNLAMYMANNNMDATWWKRVGEKREVIGDFACYLHLIMALSAR